ncbi:DNA primase [Listeria monocytogenes]|nr:DNA primase [Listeria monocytogenes]
MENKLDLVELLEYIDPSILSYQEWVNVGMSLKHEGYTAIDWDVWSRKDSGRYHEGECFKKWITFEGSGQPVTGATITQLAKDQGWRSPYKQEDGGHELDWNDTLQRDDLVIVDRNWIEGQEIQEPTVWEPAKQIIRYLETLFEPSETVAYNVQSWEDEDGKWKPSNKGAFDRTAGQLIEALTHCGDDIGSVLGDYNPEAGAWIRFNPVDGKGVKNDNVTEFRYALVESDNMSLAKQNAIMRELELPITAMLYSGGKSIHAIVKVDADNYAEYRKRVDYLYDVCKKNGLTNDNQNRNPSRLSRMPGVIRGDHKQYIIDTNIGKTSWDEWKEWIESVNDDLPDPESLDTIFDEKIELAPELIKGMLRQGHKMLIAGPSKAGKSFSLIQLAIAIAEGKQWFGFDCAQGKVLYVNLELDARSAKMRFVDIYNRVGQGHTNVGNIDIWNLRGKTSPLDKLAPKLIRRAQKSNYMAVIIDPIYKVLTGDENSAHEMAKFTNQFDKIATELGCAVIYCHHHSKGSQGGKSSIDRSSGSGVFARDPDAILDLIELPVTEERYMALENDAVCRVYNEAIQVNNPAYVSNIGQDDVFSPKQMSHHLMSAIQSQAVLQQIEEHRKSEVRSVRQCTAWRIEGTLREFPKFDPINVWFRYPVHELDDSLADIKLDEDPKENWKKGTKKANQSRSEQSKKELETAFSALSMDGGPIEVNDLVEYLDVSRQTVYNKVKKHEGFKIIDGLVEKKSEQPV